MDIVKEVHNCIAGLKESGEPYAWAAGLPRNAQIVLHYSLHRPEIDGGGTDLWETVEPLIVADIENLITTGEVEGSNVVYGELSNMTGAVSELNIAAASVRVELDEANDAYDHIFWLEVFVEFVAPEPAVEEPTE